MTDNAQKSMLSSVKAELQQSRNKAAKAQLKTLVEDHAKAMAVVDGIEQKIAEVLIEAGEDVSNIAEMLS